MCTLGLWLGFAVSAQQFQQIYGSNQVEMILDAANVSDGGFIMSGASNGTTLLGNSGFILRTDAGGNVVWNKAVGGNGMDNVSIVEPLGNDRFILAGSTSTGAATTVMNAFYGVISADGEVDWLARLGSNSEDQLRAVEPCANRDLLLTGFTRSSDPAYDVFVARVDESGELIWAYTYGTEFYEVPLKIIESQTGEIYVWGHQNGGLTQAYDAVLTKLDANGNLIWSKRYGLQANELAWDLIETESGDLLLVGDTVSGGAGLNDIFVVRVGSEGNIVWAFAYGGYSNDHGTTIRHIKNDMYAVVGGTSTFGHGGLDYLVMYINHDGAMKYANAYGGEIKDIAHNAIVTNDDGLLLLGETRSFGNGPMSGLAIRVNQDGHCACNTVVDQFEVTPLDFLISESGFTVRGEGMSVSEAGALQIIDNFFEMETLCTNTLLPTDLEVGHNNDIAPIRGEIERERMQLHPNPSNGIPVTAQLRISEAELVYIDVYNLEGKVVATQEVYGSGRTDVILPPLPAGMYLVRLTSSEQIETRRLIIR